jgi:hypothetical protein
VTTILTKSSNVLLHSHHRPQKYDDAENNEGRVGSRSPTLAGVGLSVLPSAAAAGATASTTVMASTTPGPCRLTCTPPVQIHGDSNNYQAGLQLPWPAGPAVRQCMREELLVHLPGGSMAPGQGTPAAWQVTGRHGTAGWL